MSGGTGKAGVTKLLAVALGAFAFTFALVPVYRIACEKVFGVRLEKGPVAGVAESATVAERWVTVQFDGGVNSRLPWSFEPEQMTMRVQPGQQYEALYYAKNLGDRAIVGNAVPSVAPARASGYFAKTECFCFTAQTLQPGEARDMPVRFIVDPDLPGNIQVLTLSYTFFKNETLTAQLDAAADDRAGEPAGAPHAAP